ncbi:MAG TPA: 2-dehydropantoate 2-reductase [Blastocatellia bacterium]|nr:2-dehydropantoate 2-reductase [Blastocatellia bacterium]
MTKSEDCRYVVVGAGAVGCDVGGLLHAAGASVLFVARPAIAEAIQRGLTIVTRAKETRFTGRVVTAIDNIDPEPGDILLLTVKTQSTAGVIQALSEKYSRTAPVVCMQNGVVNEEIAARSFDRVYAGLVLLTAVQLKPDVIFVSQGNTLAVGCYPDGRDELAERMRSDFVRAGFDAIASSYVMAMKWGKLVSNLNNATHAITGYSMDQSMADPEMRLLMADIREEGMRVLDAAGIAVEPPDGEPSPIRIRKMTEDLRQPPKPPADNPDALPEDRRAYASMWQDLYHGRKSHEADFLNGEIIRIGKKVGVPTPYNIELLRIIDEMSSKRLKPGLYSPKQLRSVIQR